MNKPGTPPPQHPLLGFLALALLCGIGWLIFHTNSRSPSADAATKDAAWQSAMTDAVRAKLKDPASATFRNTATHHSMGMPVVCGEVNSKNSFGGMKGFQRFVAAGDVITLEEQMATPTDMSLVWEKACR